MMRLVCCVSMLLAAPLLAEERVEPKNETPPGKGKAADRSPAKVRLKEMKIRGELEKPKIFFILPKADRTTDTKKRRLRFYPDILEPIDKDRFEEEARVLYQHGIPAE